MTDREIIEHPVVSEDGEIVFLKKRRRKIVLGVMGFFGFFLTSAMRMNMSMGIIAMVDWSKSGLKSSERECKYEEAPVRQKEEDGIYQWDLPMVGHILSCYFYGLTASQLLGLKMAERFRARHILLLATFLSAVANLTIPFATTDGGYFVMLLQLAKGFCNGAVAPCFSIVFGSWVFPAEYPLFLAVVTAGVHVGAFFTALTTGDFVEQANIGWPAVFYTTSTLGFIWCITWCALIYVTPVLNPSMRRDEQLQVLSTQLETAPLAAVPLREILTSCAVWAYMAAGFACSWIICFYATIVPLYLGMVLKMTIRINCIVTSIPALVQALVTVAATALSEHLLTSRHMKRNFVRKVCIGTGLLGTAVCMLGLNLAGCSRALSGVALTFGLGLAVIAFAAVRGVPMDMSRRYAGAISGIVNTVGSTSGIIIPVTVGYVAKEDMTVEGWAWLFYTTVTICVAAAVIFLAFGSSQDQGWNGPLQFPDEQPSSEAPPPSSEPAPSSSSDRPWRTPSFPELPSKPQPPITLMM